MIMAMGWVNNVSAILSQEAQNQIKDVSAFEDKAFGYNADTDLQDMQKVFQNYFHYQNIKIQENIKMGDIKNEIENGNVVLAPAFGRALKNPNYTAPGPVAHMLVIIGYDPDTQEFITNDSGTRHGAGYRYAENVLFDAIWEYPSGNAVLAAPTGTLKKGMLVIGSK